MLRTFTVTVDIKADLPKMFMDEPTVHVTPDQALTYVKNATSGALEQWFHCGGHEYLESAPSVEG